MISTCAGSMIVSSIAAKSKPRSLNFSLANAYAAIVQEMTLPTTARQEMTSELKKSRVKDTLGRGFQPFLKFARVQLRGSRPALAKISVLGRKAAESIQSSG